MYNPTDYTLSGCYTSNVRSVRPRYWSRCHGQLAVLAVGLSGAWFTGAHSDTGLVQNFTVIVEKASGEAWFNPVNSYRDYMTYLAQNEYNWFAGGKDASSALIHPTSDLNITIAVTTDSSGRAAHQDHTRCPDIGLMCPPSPCAFIEIGYNNPYSEIDENNIPTRGLIGIPQCGPVFGVQLSSRLNDPVITGEKVLGSPVWRHYFPYTPLDGTGKAEITTTWDYIDNPEAEDSVPVVRIDMGDRYVDCKNTIVDTREFWEIVGSDAPAVDVMYREYPVNRICRFCFVANAASPAAFPFTGNCVKIPGTQQCDSAQSTQGSKYTGHCERFRYCCKGVQENYNFGVAPQGWTPGMPLNQSPYCKNRPWYAVSTIVKIPMCCPPWSNLDQQIYNDWSSRCCVDRDVINAYYADHPDELSRCSGSQIIPPTNPNTPTCSRVNMTLPHRLVSTLAAYSRLTPTLDFIPPFPTISATALVSTANSTMILTTAPTGQIERWAQITNDMAAYEFISQKPNVAIPMQRRPNAPIDWPNLKGDNGPADTGLPTYDVIASFVNGLRGLVGKFGYPGCRQQTTDWPWNEKGGIYHEQSNYKDKPDGYCWNTDFYNYTEECWEKNCHTATITPVKGYAAFKVPKMYCFLPGVQLYYGPSWPYPADPCPSGEGGGCEETISGNWKLSSSPIIELWPMSIPQLGDLADCPTVEYPMDVEKGEWFASIVSDLDIETVIRCAIRPVAAIVFSCKTTLAWVLGIPGGMSLASSILRLYPEALRSTQCGFGTDYKGISPHATCSISDPLQWDNPQQFTAEQWANIGAVDYLGGRWHLPSNAQTWARKEPVVKVTERGQAVIYWDYSDKASTDATKHICTMNTSSDDPNSWVNHASPAHANLDCHTYLGAMDTQGQLYSSTAAQIHILKGSGFDINPPIVNIEKFPMPGYIPILFPLGYQTEAIPEEELINHLGLFDQTDPCLKYVGPPVISYTTCPATGYLQSVTVTALCTKEAYYGCGINTFSTIPDFAPPGVKFEIVFCSAVWIGTDKAVIEPDTPPIHDIFVPAAYTGVPYFEADSTNPLCDCNFASPVYRCMPMEEEKEVLCAWSWDFPANGAPSVGLLIGSILGPRAIAHSTYITDADDAAAYYTTPFYPNETTLEKYYARKPKAPADASKNDVITERVPGSCLRYPYGHTHPRTFNRTSWTPDGNIGSDALYTYCEKYLSPTLNEYQYVFCGRDKFNATERDIICKDPSINIFTTGDSLLYARRAPCNTVKNVSYCLFINGDEAYPSVENVLNTVPSTATSVVLYVAPFIADVAYAFKFNARRFDISKRSIEAPGELNNRSMWTPVADDKMLIVADSTILNQLTVPGPDTAAALTGLNARALLYQSTYASKCDNKMAIPMGVGNVPHQSAVLCGWGTELNYSSVPWPTVISGPPTTIVTVTETLYVNQTTSSILPAITLKTDTSTTAVITQNIEVPAPCTLVQVVPDVNFTGWTIDTRKGCTALIVGGTQVGNITVNASVITRPNTPIDYYVGGIAHVSGLVTLNCDHPCRSVLLNASPAEKARLIKGPGVTWVDAAELTSMFGKAEERSIFVRAPNHYHTVLILVATEFSVSGALLLFVGMAIST